MQEHKLLLSLLSANSDSRQGEVEFVPVRLIGIKDGVLSLGVLAGRACFPLQVVEFLVSDPLFSCNQIKLDTLLSFSRTSKEVTIHLGSSCQLR